MPVFIIPILVFLTTVLAVMAVMPRRNTALSARLAPYGTRVAPARERLLSGSFVERVLGPGGRRAMRLAAILAPSSIRAKAAAETAAAGAPMPVEQSLPIRTVPMIGPPLASLWISSRSGQPIGIQGMTLLGALFMGGSRLSSWLVRRKANARRSEVLR